MKKSFKHIFCVIAVLPNLLGCAGLYFADREVSMKESCILEYHGENTINFIGGKDRYFLVNSSLGMNTYILPVGTYTLGYTKSYKNLISERTIGNTREITYKWERDSASSEEFTFETGKRYKIERSGSKITITELKNGGISKGGVAVASYSLAVANFFGWRYDNNFMLFEAGPQAGFYVISDPVVMVFSGEGALGMGLFNHLNIGNIMNFPYRAGGSVAAYFGNSNFVIGLGGGITGYVFSMDLFSDDNPFPQVPLTPYIQMKLTYKSLGLFFDYYPTQTPIGIGSFGFGMTMMDL